MTENSPPFYRRWRGSTWVLILLGIIFLSSLHTYSTNFGGLLLIALLALIVLVLRKLVDAIAAGFLAMFEAYYKKHYGAE